MKNLCFLISFFLFFQFIYPQDGVPFKENKQFYLQGNSILIGNNILGDDPTEPLMDIGIPNDVVKMKYIDIDNDETTFSSSEAIIKSTPVKPKISYAALYWCGLYPDEKSALRKSGNRMVHVGRGERDAAVNSILFKTPSGIYETLIGKIIFDSYNTEVFKTNSPYVCYADVTTKLQNLATINGTYTVANVKATEGEISGGGSAGWLLYVIYEDPSESPKYFTTYNGLVEVNKEVIDIDFKGFKSKEEGGYDPVARDKKRGGPPKEDEPEKELDEGGAASRYGNEDRDVGRDRMVADRMDEEQEEGVFAPNHYCVHHGGVEHNGAVQMAEAVSHNWNDELGQVTHYDMKLKDGTILGEATGKPLEFN